MFHGKHKVTRKKNNALLKQTIILYTECFLVFLLPNSDGVIVFLSLTFEQLID